MRPPSQLLPLLCRQWNQLPISCHITQTNSDSEWYLNQWDSSLGVDHSAKRSGQPAFVPACLCRKSAASLLVESEAEGFSIALASNASHMPLSGGCVLSIRFTIHTVSGDGLRRTDSASNASYSPRHDSKVWTSGPGVPSSTLSRRSIVRSMIGAQAAASLSSRISSQRRSSFPQPSASASE